MKKAIILYNLGGPDKLENVEPFLFNLFYDPAILNLPSFIRYPLAKLIANRRTPTAKNIYKELGGFSPILKLTEEQATALEVKLNKDDNTSLQVINKKIFWDNNNNKKLSNRISKWEIQPVYEINVNIPSPQIFFSTRVFF